MDNHFEYNCFLLDNYIDHLNNWFYNYPSDILTPNNTIILGGGSLAKKLIYQLITEVFTDFLH